MMNALSHFINAKAHLRAFISNLNHNHLHFLSFLQLPWVAERLQYRIQAASLANIRLLHLHQRFEQFQTQFQYSHSSQHRYQHNAQEAFEQKTM